MKPAWLFAVLIGFAWVFPAKSSLAASLRPVSLYGRSYVDLKDWAEHRSFDFTINLKEETVLLTNRWSRLEFSIDSKRARINGTTVWLSFAVAGRNGSAFISEKDIQAVLTPVLYPQTLPGKKIRTVAISAGHGGKDPGYIQGRHQEKVYTLLLAKQLETALVQAGLKVVQIRSTDKYVPLEDQPLLAQRKGADLFVCLHFNCSELASNTAKGVETYCLAPVGTSATNGGDSSNRLWDGNRFDSGNILLAYHVQGAMVRNLEMADRGVRRARFVVLRNGRIPGILIEGGFMSHKEDAKRIFDPSGRREMAHAIVDGILAYKRLIERSSTPPVATKATQPNPVRKLPVKAPAKTTTRSKTRSVATDSPIKRR